MAEQMDFAKFRELGLAYKTAVGEDVTILLEHTSILPQTKTQLSPQVRRRNQARAKFRR